MLGVIRKRDIVLHPVVTVQSFGWRVFLRALTAGPNETFLSLVAEAETRDTVRRRVPEVMDRAIGLEIRAMRLYQALAGRFADEDALRQLFATLAVQEQEHAELLRVCRHAARRNLIDARCLLPFAQAIPGLEAAMEGAQSFLSSDYGRLEALRLVLRLESSEINQVFDGIVAASPSEFIRTLSVFHMATREHLTYIRNVVSSIEPSLEDECRKLVP
jgi:hypothetical protein